MAGVATLLLMAWLILVPFLAAMAESHEQAFGKTRLYAALITVHLLSAGAIMFISDSLDNAHEGLHVLALNVPSVLTTFVLFPAIGGALAGTARFAPPLGYLVLAGFPMLLIISGPQIYEGFSLLFSPLLQPTVVQQIGYNQEWNYHYAILANDQERSISQTLYEQLSVTSQPTSVRLASFNNSLYGAQEIALPSQYSGTFWKEVSLLAYLLVLPVICALFTRLPASRRTGEWA